MQTFNFCTTIAIPYDEYLNWAATPDVQITRIMIIAIVGRYVKWMMVHEQHGMHTIANRLNDHLARLKRQ